MILLALNKLLVNLLTKIGPLERNVLNLANRKFKLCFPFRRFKLLHLLS